MLWFRLCFVLPLFLALSSPADGEVVFSWATIGNAGNAPDPTTGFGAVDYEYRISTTEVTNAQYVEFLNSVEQTSGLPGDDPSLYVSLMRQISSGGITWSGSPGNYTFATKPNMANKPVNYVSLFDAMRFVNWLHNGQGDGDTETGVYTIGSGLDAVRAPNARFWIPDENEWYKAAYHHPASQGGDLDDYWLYPTSSNTPPETASSDSSGDIVNTGARVANFDFAGLGNDAGGLTTVGTAGEASMSFYGTHDQGGNVWEWTESLVSGPLGPCGRLRGGSLIREVESLQAINPIQRSADSFHYEVGFRVASIPEPQSLSLLMLLSGSLFGCTWRLRMANCPRSKQEVLA
ncbi:MAG: SUMF1/EgtB/PvdO family nonheme iron enzyme [Pirellulales bacterium]